MLSVVITGATSFIGVHLIEEWLKRECVIHAVVRPGSRNMARLPRSEVIKTIELDFENYDQLPGRVGRADVFYHLAWDGARGQARSDAALQERSHRCAVSAMTAAHQLGASLFVGCGSQAEYGVKDGIVTETSPCNPTTEYGRAKLKTAERLRAMAEEYRMRFVWLRIFSLYGQHDYEASLIMTCLDKMRKNEPVALTQCVQDWDYLYVKDAVEAMVKLFDAECASGIYNLASGDIRPMKAFVEDMRSALGTRSEILYGAVPYPPEGPVNLRPGIRKITDALHWKAQTAFIDGIREICRGR